MKSIHMLLASVAVLAAPTTAAFAQEGEVVQDDATAETAPAEEVYSDNEIIVSATRRDQAAQDVPLAVSVVGGEQLANAGVVDIRGIQQLAPSLKTTTGQSSATGAVLSIRGIGTAGDNPGFEPAVGVFIDGVFRSRAGVALAELPPIERVEVLRGPQGTLFGRNTSAGALNITTQKPKFEFGGYVEASYGNLDEIEVKAGVTGPVSELFALRLDGGYHKRDGYITDVNSGNRINNIDRYFVRGQALFENEDVSFRFIGDYAKTDEVCCGAVNTLSGLQIFPGIDTSTNSALALVATNVINNFAGNPALGGSAGRVGIPAIRQRQPPDGGFAGPRPWRKRSKEWGVSGELNWDFGGATLTSITAYRDWDARRNQDIDFSGLDRAYRDNYRTGIKDFTQEIRLQGTAFNDSVDWLVGGFYLNEKLTLNDTVRFGNQADQYVDGVINGLTRSATLPTGLQLFGTLGPAVPVFGGVPLPRTPAGAGQQNDAYKVDTEAFAAFTHNIINFTDNLSLTLGLRYNRETKDIDTDLNSAVPACSFFLSPASAAYRAGLQAAGLYGPAFLLTCNPTVNSEFNGVRSDSRSERRIHRHGQAVVQGERRCAGLWRLRSRLQVGRV